MKFAVVGAVACALGATAAQAQVGMTCRTTISGRQECTESAGARAERLNRESMERLQRSMESSGPSESDLAASRKRSLQKKIAKLIKAGKCGEAKAAALDAGDLDTADQAVRLCTPAG